jgi:hypothetical protein
MPPQRCLNLSPHVRAYCPPPPPRRLRHHLPKVGCKEPKASGCKLVHEAIQRYEQHY